MIQQLRELPRRVRAALEPEPPSLGLAPLRAAAAQLLLVTGVQATLDQLSSRSPESPYRPTALAWAPALLGPLAAAAQLTHARDPSETTATALRLLNASVIGLGIGILAADLFQPRARSSPHLFSVAFASSGLLGWVIDRADAEVARRDRVLRRRADLVQRFTPRRRTKLDRVVVHV